MQTRTTYALVAATAVIWGANFNLSKHVLVDLYPLVAGAARFDIAALVMLAITSILVPVSSMVISAFEGEPPTWVQLAGGAVVIGAVSLASLSPTRSGLGGLARPTPAVERSVSGNAARPHCP